MEPARFRTEAEGACDLQRRKMSVYCATQIAWQGANAGQRFVLLLGGAVKRLEIGNYSSRHLPFPILSTDNGNKSGWWHNER